MQGDTSTQSTGSKNRPCLKAGSVLTGCVTLDKLLTSLCLSSSFLKWAKNSTYLRTVTGLDGPYAEDSGCHTGSGQPTLLQEHYSRRRPCSSETPRLPPGSRSSAAGDTGHTCCHPGLAPNAAMSGSRGSESLVTPFYGRGSRFRKIPGTPGFPRGVMTRGWTHSPRVPELAPALVPHARPTSTSPKRAPDM